MFQRIRLEGRARRGEYTTPHGTVQTPVFMNVGTQAAIKGGLSADDLPNIGCQVELSNTYHLHVRPGDELIAQMGGLHRFMGWDGPILTDSGGFQIFSLDSLRRIKEEGVYFNSHVDGRHIFMGPEESMRIQANLGSDIAMAFDECVGRTSAVMERVSGTANPPCSIVENILRFSAMDALAQKREVSGAEKMSLSARTGTAPSTNRAAKTEQMNRFMTYQLSNQIRESSSIQAFRSSRWASEGGARGRR